MEFMIKKANALREAIEVTEKVAEAVGKVDGCRAGIAEIERFEDGYCVFSVNVIYNAEFAADKADSKG